MAVWLSADVFENTIDVLNNTSNVVCNLYANWDGGSWNGDDNTYGYIQIDGTQYNFIIRSTRVRRQAEVK
jgi:hypothetical protein